MQFSESTWAQRGTFRLTSASDFSPFQSTQQHFVYISRIAVWKRRKNRLALVVLFVSSWRNNFLSFSILIFSNLNYFHFNKHVTFEFPCTVGLYCLPRSSSFEMIRFSVYRNTCNWYQPLLIKISSLCWGENCANSDLPFTMKTLARLLRTDENRLWRVMNLKSKVATKKYFKRTVTLTISLILLHDDDSEKWERLKFSIEIVLGWSAQNIVWVLPSWLWLKLHQGLSPKASSCVQP